MTETIDIPAPLIREARQHGAKSAAALAGALARREGVELPVAIEQLRRGYDAPVDGPVDYSGWCNACLADPMSDVLAKSRTAHGELLANDRKANGKCPQCGTECSEERE